MYAIGIKGIKQMRKSLIFLVFLLVSACALSPTGRRQLMIVSPEEAITASKSAYIQTLAPLKKSGKLDTNLKVSRRVRLITGKLVAQAIQQFPESKEWDWDIRVIENDEVINAWCMAGGKMAIYSGLIKKIKPSDDELAQVLGHEIAHALANHTAEKMSVAMASQLGLATVAIVTGGSSGGNATMASAELAAGVAIQLPNSRQAEFEADRIGIELAARAGYDPRAAETLWQKMSDMGNSDFPDFISTHPNALNRMAILRRLAPEMMPLYSERKVRPIYTFNIGR